MKKQIILAIIIIGLIYSNNLLAKGKSVTVYLKGEKIKTGELLYVEQNDFLLCIPEGLSDDEIYSNPGYLLRIERSNIDSIFIEGESNLSHWSAIGGLIGFIAGAALTITDNSLWRWVEITVGGGIGGLIGTGIGGIVGLVDSNRDVLIVIDSKYDFKNLSQYSRYEKEEPYYLTKIIK